MSLSNSNNKVTTLNVGGNMSMSGGMLNESKENGLINFVGSSLHTFSNTGGTISNNINFTVQSGSTLDVGTSVITGDGVFTLAAGATLITANAGGIAQNGASGSIQTAVQSLSPSANYIFNGTSLQVLGTAVTTVNNLTIDNSAGVTISDNLTVNNILTLENGNLSLGSLGSNLTIANGATISCPSGYDNTHMIVCDGSGSLIKQSNNTAGLQMVFPVGTGILYSPVNITSLSASVAGIASVSVRAVSGTASGATTDLQKYWELASANLSTIVASLAFTYNNPDEVGVGGDQSSYVPYLLTGGSWIAPSGSSTGGVNPMTVISSATLTGTWTGREGPATYYSYQSGNWTVASTWTTDPSGTLSVSPSVPGAMDRAVILNGRTVTMTSLQSALSTNINEGGVLDIKNITGHNLGAVRGKGTMRLSTGIFPGGVFDEFVSADGGTVEYYNSGDYTVSQLEYNNLIFNHSTSAITTTIAGNLVVNSDLTVEKGTFQINGTGTTRLDLAVFGDLLVKKDGNITLGTGSIGTATTDAHRLTIQGDFINYGDVRFTNLTAPNYLSYPNHRVDVVFNNPNSDQNVQIYGLTRFYRIEVDKGTDQTYVLNIDASANGLFELFGRNNLLGSTTTPSAPSINNTNALGLMAGTLRLGTNITVPSLAEENVSSDDLNYHIDEDACLWIDGANVTHTTHVNGGTSNSFVLYGKIRMTNPTSVFNLNTQHGIVMRANAAIEVHDGLLTVPCIRSSTIAGVHRGSYTQKGGAVSITGNISGANRHPSL